MNRAINVLVVEDSEGDALLVIRTLRAGGFDVQFERVETAAAMTAALQRQAWDAIIADYRLPSFTGLDALRILRNSGTDIPFILVSGAIGEEIAVAAMKAGASDYLMKGNLARLAPAMTRELNEAAARAAHRHVQRDLVVSEARFRGLANLSSDWYWEQDADYRFTVVGNGIQERSNLDSAGHIGRTRWELPTLNMTQSDWAQHKALLDARLPFRNLELCRAGVDGRLGWVSTSGEPVFDARGLFSGYRGVGTAISERKYQERILLLEHRIARCLAEHGAQSAVIAEVIRAICETQGWQCGLYRRTDDDAGILHLEQCWGVPGQVSEVFFDQMRDLAIARGTELSGRAWESREPVWVVDASTDTRLVRSDIVQAVGWGGMFAFPVIAEGRVVGVLSFYNYEVREPDARLLSAVRVIGDQVGQFLQRVHAENQLRDSEERYRTLTELSSDWYWEHDEEGRFTRVSDRFEDWAGIGPSELIGMTRWETGIRCTAATRVALEADVDARRPFRDLEFNRVEGNGSVRYVTISGTPMFDESNRFIGYRGVGKEITARKAAESRLRFQAQLLDTVGDAVIASDPEGKITYVNSAAEKLYGWPAAELLRKSVFDTIRTEASRKQDFVSRQEVVMGRVWRGEVERRRRDQTVFPIELTLAPVWDAEGANIGSVGVSNDISERKQVERALREKVSQQGLIAAFSQGALARTDLEELWDLASVAVRDGLDVEFCKLLEIVGDGQLLVAKAGSNLGEAWVQSDVANASPGTQNRFALDAREPLVVEDFLRETRFTPPAVMARHGIRSGANVLIRGASGIYGILGAYSRDVGRFAQESCDFLQSIASALAAAIERKAATEQLAYQAQFDALTGLPNRSLVRDRLAQTLTQAKRNDSRVAVTVVDLDHFKLVNDTMGHGTGDRVLIAVAQRLQDSVGRADTLGRLDGDNFAIIYSDLATTDDANIAAQNVVDALASPFSIDGHEFHLTASVGIAVYPVDGEDFDLLLAHADTAMHRAKEHGTNHVVFYAEEMNVRAMHRLELQRELRLAVERNEFMLHYQPEISLDSGRIIGVEALIRWQHPVRGLLAPAEFIAAAEQSGLIVPIGQWVVETACAQAAEWHRRGHRDLFVAVNVSPAQMRRADVGAQIRAALARSGLDPHYLEIEVTETLVMDGAEAFIRTLGALKAIGISIAVDDFGTGYSSLSYLRRFPIDKVKIDRMFIHDMTTDPGAAGIVRAIIAMAHHLQLRVTAEGIETEEHAEFLRRNQCDIGQGFLLGRPVAAGEVSALLDSRSGTPSVARPGTSLRSLLLVDDEENNLQALQRVLRNDGYEIHTATSARKALELLARTRVSVIVSDQRMAGMSGTEFLGRVRALYPDTVRIVLSGFLDLKSVTAAINEGAIFKFLTKPWEDDVLREHIRQAFHHHERQAAGPVGGVPALTSTPNSGLAS